MPTRTKKQSDGEDIAPTNRKTPTDLSFEVVEWLEFERLEHEKRMQELGCDIQQREKLETRGKKLTDTHGL